MKREKYTSSRSPDTNGDNPLFDKSEKNHFPSILSPKQAALFLGVSLNTIYLWLSRGYLKKCSRKRGKHVFIKKDQLVEVVFNGPFWN